jgi:surface protein
MDSMFYGCHSLMFLDLENFNCEKIYNLNSLLICDYLPKNCDIYVIDKNFINITKKIKRI